MMNMEKVPIALSKNILHERHLFNLQNCLELKENDCIIIPSLAKFCMGRKAGLGPYTEYCRLAVTGRRLPLLPHPAKPQCCGLWSDSSQSYNCWLESVSELRLPVPLNLISSY